MGGTLGCVRSFRPRDRLTVQRPAPESQRRRTTVALAKPQAHRGGRSLREGPDRVCPLSFLFKAYAIRRRSSAVCLRSQTGNQGIRQEKTGRTPDPARKGRAVSRCSDIAWLKLRAPGLRTTFGSRDRRLRPLDHLSAQQLIVRAEVHHRWRRLSTSTTTAVFWTAARWFCDQPQLPARSRNRSRPFNRSGPLLRSYLRFVRAMF